MVHSQCLYVDYVFHCKYADGVAYPYIGLYMHCALTIYALQHRDGYMQLGASTILPQQPIVWCVNQNPIKINNLFAQEYKAKKWNTQNQKEKTESGFGDKSYPVIKFIWW